MREEFTEDEQSKGNLGPLARKEGGAKPGRRVSGRLGGPAVSVGWLGYFEQEMQYREHCC